MNHSQELLRKASKTVNCMWTFASPTCTGLHADTPHTHVHTWYTRSSPTLIPRRCPWAVIVGWSLQPSGHESMMRFIRCQSSWLLWTMLKVVWVVQEAMLAAIFVQCVIQTRCWMLGLHNVQSEHGGGAKLQVLSWSISRERSYGYRGGESVLSI